MLSKRIKQAYDGTSFLADALFETSSNRYHSVINPRGIINFGTSENRIVYDKIEERLSQITFKSFPRNYAYYCEPSGVPELRHKLSSFLNEYMKPTMETTAENIFVLNGAGPAIETLGFSFCDEGEMILTPAPYYGAFTSDLYQRFGVLLSPINLPSDDLLPYNLSVEILKESLDKAKKEGKKIKALLLSNPNNPLGTIYSIEQMESYAQFCYENNLHLISDEIYFFSTRDETGTSMKSILSLKNFSKYKDIIHVIWGFSKDFGISGFRCGVIITYRQDLQKGLGQVGVYSCLPTTAQFIFIHLISDWSWFESFILINRRRLNKSLSIVVDTLKELDIPYIWPSGGLFIWIKLFKYLKSNAIESENEIFQDFMNNGVYIAPGFAFGSMEHGWFRIVISVDESELKLGLKRFKLTLNTLKEKLIQNGSPIK